MKISATPINTIIELLNDFCTKCDIKPSEQTIIAESLKEVKGNINIEILQKAMHQFMAGNIDLKTPFRLNVVFLSQLISRYFDFNRSANKQFTEEKTVHPPQETINAIFEEGINESQRRLKSWLNGEDVYFDPFFLYNEYDWLVENKGLDANNYDSNDIDDMQGLMMKYDKLNSRKKDSFNKTEFTPTMKKNEYMKAAVVALYLNQ